MRFRSHSLLNAVVAALAGSATARAAVSVYLSPDAVAAQAPVILEGRVEAVDTGYDPVTARVATYVTIDVTRVLRGPVAAGRVVLREHGGVYGELVHVSEAAAEYRPGEDVLVFAESARDGALRTAAGFFGKFVRVPSTGATAVVERRLRGHGLILRGPAAPEERFARSDLLGVAALEARPALADACAPERCRSAPAELGRLLWNSRLGGSGTGAADAPRPEFAPLSVSNPARWDEMDSGASVPIDVERARAPLGNPADAVAEIGRAIAAWNAVPDSRVQLRLGNTDVRYTTFSFSSPADVYPASNIVLFGDPYDDLTDPASCAGTIAYGGYWRSGTPTKTVNGVLYYPIRRSYIIFNRNFECFLGTAANLAEIATHELGHGLGFGHSSVADSIMRGWPYGGRGAVLGADDRNAAHCAYPHSFAVAQPNGGENWRAGTLQTVRWTATSDSGGDAGRVDVELSLDSGTTWSTVTAGTPNDGSYEWSVPPTPSAQARVRIVRRTEPVPGGTASVACSQDASNAPFTIAPPSGPAGGVPETGAGALTLARNSSGRIDLAWGASCGSPSGYVVYEGSLGSLAAGVWDHKALQCAAGPALTQSVAAEGANRYYLVAASTPTGEGPLGAGSSGLPRPESLSACAPREAATCP